MFYIFILLFFIPKLPVNASNSVMDWVEFYKLYRDSSNTWYGKFPTGVCTITKSKQEKCMHLMLNGLCLRESMHCLTLMDLSKVMSIIQPFVNDEVNQYFNYALIALKISSIIWILAFTYLLRNLMHKNKKFNIQAFAVFILLFGVCWFIYSLRSGLDASSFEKELSWYNKIRKSQLEYNLLRKELFVTMKYIMYANGFLALCF
jgi:hypothetical protein